MAVNKPRRLGSFAPLSSRYYYDDAILNAGEKAEVLWCRGLAFCSGALSDGVITDTQLRMVIGVGLSGVKQRADLLVRHGLWERVDRGYRVRTWLKWNRSLAEIEDLQAADAGRKRDGRPDSKRNGTGNETDSERTGAGVPNGSGPESDSVPDGLHPRARTPSQAKPSKSQAKPAASQATGADSVRPEDSGGGPPPAAAAEQFVIDNLNANPDEATTLVERIRTERRPRNLPGLLRTMHRDGDLAAMLAELREAAAADDVAEQVAQARRGPNCPHGDPGGAALHPVTGLPLCPLCRRSSARSGERTPT